jgi:hypothetical protein
VTSAPIRSNVRFGSKADIETLSSNFRFTPKADMDHHGRDVRFVPKADILRCGEIRRYSITSSAQRKVVLPPYGPGIILVGFSKRQNRNPRSSHPD